MPATELVPLLVAAVIVATGFWVYNDAKNRTEGGAPVVFCAGSLATDTPAMWTVGCLILWILFLPVYLTSRG